jgi:hypothetical protein
MKRMRGGYLFITVYQLWLMQRFHRISKLDRYSCLFLFPLSFLCIIKWKCLLILILRLRIYNTICRHIIRLDQFFIFIIDVYNSSNQHIPFFYFIARINQLCSALGKQIKHNAVLDCHYIARCIKRRYFFLFYRFHKSDNQPGSLYITSDPCDLVILHPQCFFQFSNRNCRPFCPNRHE